MKQFNFTNDVKGWWCLFIITTISLNFAFAQNTAPKILGYVTGQSVKHISATDTFTVSFNGGGVVNTQHILLNGATLPRVDTSVNTNSGLDAAMSGFKYGVVFSPNAFEKEMFVSKGYYPDYIQLSWEIIRFQSQVTGYKIYRKLVGSTAPYVQVANLSNSSTNWKDEFAESGVMYEYKLLAEGLFPFEKPYLNILTGIGFRLPSGKVSGRVTYEGGGSVQGVTLIAETADNFDGTSLELNGVNSNLAISPPSGHEHFKLNSKFTFQGWFKPTAATTSTLFQKGAQYKITHTNGNVTFNANGTNVAVNFTQKADTFFQVTAVRDLDSLRLYVMYGNDLIYKNASGVPASTPSNTDEILIGKSSTNTQYYKGLIDEIRIWHRALPESEIKVRSFMYISGTEDSLSAYYRMNEGVGENFYDLSRKGFNFNEKHGYMSPNVAWSTEIPTRTQLAVKGYTDANGNYLISGIPYTSDGSTYRIVPAFGVHSFDPTERLMFIGPGSNVYSDVNFVDVASFQITGEVFYKGTRFPVDGVQIKIDDITAVTSEGLPITTDANGQFKVDVPIGRHQLKLEKYGHVFRGGGYFPDSISNYDFQQPFAIQTRFLDTTLIKVVGKVVGGPIQEAKAQGMGRTTNNIGRAKITLTTQGEWDLKDVSGVDSSGTWNLEYFHHSLGVKKVGETSYKVADVKPKEIEIKPDPTTGEYVAYMLPEKYVIKRIVAGAPDAITPKYTFDNSYHTVLDLSGSYFQKTEIDSVLDVTTFSINPSTGDTVYNYLYDSLHYQAEKNFILRLKPQVNMTSKDKTVDRFWEEKVTTESGSEVAVVSSDDFGDWLTPEPIFRQQIGYKTKITVFEQYENVDNSNVIDEVPVVDGKVRIQNNLAIETKTLDFDLDERGELDYEFKGGLPNTAEGGIGSFLKTMTVKVFTGKGGTIVSDWPSDGTGFRGYIFGGMPTGNNFVSTGPNVVSMIIRDPHGSNSFAFYETGTSTSTEVSYDVENGETIEAEARVLLGTKTTTFAGVGAGVIVEAEITNDLGIGIEQSTNFIDNTTSVVTTSNTKTWSTSAEPDFVGANGDVFVGNSTNIVYGKNIYIELLPKTECDLNPDAKCVDLPSIATYGIGISEGIRLSPEFNTGFQYSQNHIKNYLIPQLEDLRNNFYLKKQNVSEYQCVICTGAEYAKSNNTKTLIRRADNSGVNGDSYNINYPVAWPDTLEYIDSVAWYNSQIKNWENLLRRNEKEKIDAELLQNYSYDAGTIFESTTTVENSDSRTETFEWTLNPSIVGNKGAKIAGMGVQMSISATYNHKETKATTTNTTTSSTFGFTLNDGDEGDFYSIDVKDAGTGTGPVFSVRGGQSMCPYVDAELSEYVPGDIVLSEATMRREQPKISVAQAIVNNVPQGKTANFSLQLSNVAETGDDAWYRLSIDESTITGGALQIDGANIKDGRTFFIPAGTTLNKSLNLRQVVPDSFRFENVRLVLHSMCQFDPGDNWDDISDTVEVSAYFQPACSDILIKNPDDLWLVNTATIQYDGTVIKSIPMNIGLNNYDLNHSTFEKMAVQYKSSTSSQWISDMIYYVDKTQFDAASEPKSFINGASELNYTLETKKLKDRNYDIRLQTQCADGTVNASETVSGIKDVKRPKLFGTPQPGDGILSPGDDIMVMFDEDIQAGLLTSFNFTVKGVLNGAEIAHNSVLFFDGVDDNASVIEGVDLTDKSFAIEFWTKRLDNNAGVIFSEGDLEIGFNGANNFYVKFGSQTVTSSATYTTANDWMHWAVSYDYNLKKVSCYMNDLIPIDNILINSLYTVKSRMFVGQSMTATNHYNGYIHDLRVWETVRGQGSVVANMNVSQSGDKVGLSGFWPMDEADGAIATDLSRNHHALLNGAAWVVFPRGYARTFNGSSDNIAFNSGEVIVTNEMDMTIEFWMKGDPQTNTVVFSNGKGDGTDPSPPMENIWVMGADANGKFYALNNGTTLTIEKQVFDSEWHHVALVIKRIANTAVYIDGNQEAFNLSSHFGGLSGAQMALGARQFRSVGTFTFDKHFAGKVDEFRIWKLAKTKQLIDLDKNAKLIGDEIGLLAYYPFDTYDVNLVIQPTLNDQVEGSSKVGVATGTLTDNADVPNIKDARPVQKVRYNWVVNEDQIILNIEEDPELIENVVLEITAQDIEDLNENRLASPIAWTAYIKKNTVLWNQTSLSFEKKLYEKVTFEVEVLNLGGTEQNYEITNIPGWLSIDEATGTLSPDSKKTLVFEISESTNIGNYEHSLYLGSDFGFKEKLELNLKVKGDEPIWEVDAGKYEYNMSVIGTLTINGIVSTNPDDKIAAYINGELRGVANLQYIESYDMYEFFLDVFSDQTNGDSIEFRVWNASEGKVQVDVTPKLTFNKDNIVGSPSAPQQFIVTENVIVAYPLKKGWNWYSFNLNSSVLNNSRDLFTDLTSTDGDIVKALGRFDQFGANLGWIGEVTKQGGFNVRETYKMKVEVADTFYVKGASIETSSIDMNVTTGWNWVGFPSEYSMQINDALGNVNFENGDFIKAQNGFAIYDQYLGWIGSLKTMKPTYGYMLKTASNHTLTYPNAQTLVSSTRKAKQQLKIASTAPWSVNAADFSKDMSFIIKLNCDIAIDTANDYLGVFVGTENRGFIKPMYISSKDEYLFFLSAYSNTNGETLSFSYFDGSASEEYPISTNASFMSDAIVGDVSDPFLLSFEQTITCDLISNLDDEFSSDVLIYPNPFDSSVLVKVKGLQNSVTHLTISDISGKIVQNLTSTNAEIIWDGKNSSGQEVSAGMYLLTIDNNNIVQQVKLIKNK